MRPTDILIEIDRQSPEPLQVQVFKRVRAMVLDGRLPPGTRLPATRVLAKELGIGRNTALLAYERLTMEGYVIPGQGGGTKVAPLAPDHFLSVGTGDPGDTAVPVRQSGLNLSARGAGIIAARGAGRIGTHAAFAPGQPAVDQFPTRLWNRLLADAVARPQLEKLGYGHVAGWPDLRAAIATQVRAARSVQSEDRQIIITTGAQSALTVAAHLLTEPGDTAWIEDPGYLGARAALVGAGLKVSPVPVDNQGLMVEAGLRNHGRPKLVYVTPSHQFPTGTTLSLARRLALLEAAEQTGAVIVEDDYDSEFRFTGRPLTSLQGLAVERFGARARVIYVGTFAKTLFPGLRMGFAIVPRELALSFAAGVRAFGCTPPIQSQIALARFISDGHYATHVRRMRVTYQRRQGLLLDAVARHMPDAGTITPPDGGMQVAMHLDDKIDDIRLASAGAAAGLTLVPMSALYLGQTPQSGLHLGFAAVPDDQIEPAVKKLAALLTARPGH